MAENSLKDEDKIMMIVLLVVLEKAREILTAALEDLVKDINKDLMTELEEESLVIKMEKEEDLKVVEMTMIKNQEISMENS